MSKKLENIEKLKDVFMEKLLKEEGYENFSIEHVFEKLRDVSLGNKYIFWVIKQYLTGEIDKFEDMDRVKKTLILFNKNLSKLSKEQKEIQKINFRDLEDIVLGFEKIEKQKEIEKEQKNKIYKETKIIYSGAEGKIVVPLSYESSVFWGQGTKWCTAMKETREHYDRYVKDGYLYIFISTNKDDKGREIKHQVHFETNNFMNASDVAIDSKSKDYLAGFIPPKILLETILKYMNGFTKIDMKLLMTKLFLHADSEHEIKKCLDFTSKLLEANKKLEEKSVPVFIDNFDKQEKFISYKNIIDNPLLLGEQKGKINYEGEIFLKTLSNNPYLLYFISKHHAKNAIEAIIKNEKIINDYLGIISTINYNKLLDVVKKYKIPFNELPNKLKKNKVFQLYLKNDLDIKYYTGESFRFMDTLGLHISEIQKNMNIDHLCELSYFLNDFDTDFLKSFILNNIHKNPFVLSMININIKRINMQGLWETNQKFYDYKINNKISYKKEQDKYPINFIIHQMQKDIDKNKNTTRYFHYLHNFCGNEKNNLAHYIHNIFENLDFKNNINFFKSYLTFMMSETKPTRIGYALIMKKIISFDKYFSISNNDVFEQRMRIANVDFNSPDLRQYFDEEKLKKYVENIISYETLYCVITHPFIKQFPEYVPEYAKKNFFVKTICGEQLSLKNDEEQKPGL